MVMLDTLNEMDIQQWKMQRAHSRKVNMSKKRKDYQRSNLKRSLSEGAGNICTGLNGHDQAKPHRAARAALRTFLARNAIGAESDLPTISMGRPGCRKPSVSPFLTYKDHPIQDEFILDEVNTDLTADGKKACMLEADDWDTTASEGECDIMKHAEKCSSEVSGAQASLSDLSSESEADIEATTSFEKGGVGELSLGTFSKADAKCLQTEGEDLDTCKSTPAVIRRRDEEDQCHHERSLSAKRETILRNVAAQLQQRAREAEKEAAAANAKVDVMQSTAASPKYTRSDVKQALQIEKRRAAELRKKRNQAAHVQALQDKAKRALQEAKEIRDKAENEAAAVKVALLEGAYETAQSEAAVSAQQQIFFSLMEADALKQESLKAKAEMDANVQSQMVAAKLHAKSEILQMMTAAEMEVKAQSHAMVQAAQAMADNKVCAAKEKALTDASNLMARVEEQMLLKAEVEERSRLAMLEEARVRAELQARKEAECKLQPLAQKLQAQKRREATRGLKQAKELEQQRNKKFRKQALMDRQLEQQKQKELDAIRSEVMQETQEALELAAREASKLRSRAKADARTIRARARSKVQANTKAEVANMFEAAEAEAQAARKRADQEAQEMISELAREQLQAHALLESHEEQAESQKVSVPGPLAASEESEGEDEWEVLPKVLLQPVSDTCGWDIVA